MRRDTGIYDKYLNMKPKEKKKLDLRVRFDSKAQKVGVIIFGVGLLLLCFGFIFMFSKKYADKVVPEDGPVLKNVNVKDFNSISTEDGLVTIDATTVTYKKDVGLSEMNLRLSVNKDLDELPIKIIFDLDGKEIVIVDYLQGITMNEPVSLFKQNENDLSMADNWRVEVTTKEDLSQNYGFEFN